MAALVLGNVLYLSCGSVWSKETMGINGMQIKIDNIAYILWSAKQKDEETWTELGVGQRVTVIWIWWIISLAPPPGPQKPLSQYACFHFSPNELVLRSLLSLIRVEVAVVDSKHIPKQIYVWICDAQRKEKDACKEKKRFNGQWHFILHVHVYLTD